MRKRGRLSEFTYKKGVPLAWLEAYIANPTATDECILWPFGTDKGYGTLWIDGKCERATRVICRRLLSTPETWAWEACHSCDNPSCINVRHLFVGTHHDNMIDATRKGIMNKKLTAAQVRQIRALRDTMLQREIAAQYGINQTVVGDILRRKKWKHLH